MDSYHTLHLLSVLPGMFASLLKEELKCLKHAMKSLIYSLGWICRFRCLALCHQTLQIPSTG